MRRVKTSRGDSYEYLVNIPREWVEAVVRDQRIELADTEKGIPLYLKIRYDGKLEMEPKVVTGSSRARALADLKQRSLKAVTVILR